MSLSLSRKKTNTQTNASEFWEAARDLYDDEEYRAAQELIDSGGPPQTPEQLLIAGMVRSALDGRDQDKAKDLITQSMTSNETHNARASIYLALCYWRAGEMQEALAYSEDAAVFLTAGADGFCAALIRAVILRAANQMEPALEMLERCNHLALRVGLVARGKSHNQRALTHRAVGQFFEAASEYEKASLCFEEAGKELFEGIADTNVSALLLAQGHDLLKAHAFADRAVSIFTRLGDPRQGNALDQRAQVEIALTKYRDAERSAHAAVRRLENENSDFYAEAMITHGKALARCGRVKEAQEQIEKACKLCEHLGDTARAGEGYATLLEEVPVGYRTALHAFLRADELSADKKRVLRLGVKVAAIIEPSLIQAALDSSDGSITKAGEVLGMPRSVLMKRIEDHPELRAHRKPQRVRRWKTKPYVFSQRKK